MPSQHWYLALRLLADREVDETDDNGNTLLHLAADAGHPEVIAVAVKSGASVTVTNRKGLTPGQLAQRRRKWKKHTSSFHNDSPGQDLHQACSDGDAETVKVVLCQGASLSEKGDNGDTPLHSACRAGQTEVASLLIQLGADIHTKNSEGCTPLHYASESGQVDTARLLVEHGADVNVKEGDEVTVDTVRLLVEHGAGVSMKGNDGVTPVPGACESGQVDTVGLLMEHDADVNVKGGDEVAVNAVGLLLA